MVHLHSAKDVTTYNQRSLKTLLRAIALSQGQFSLILVRCNYGWLAETMLSQVKEASSIVIGELALPSSVNTLYTTIQDYLEADQPQALSIFNLQNVKKIEQVLNSTNQVREEFRKRFPFPLILWIDDLVLEKMIRHAPDFKSWAATSIKFEIPTQELIQFLRQKADKMFAKVLDAGAEPFFDNGAVQLEMGALQRQVLDLAQKDLQKQDIRLDEALTASLEFILGRDDYANDLLDDALEHYQTSLSFWQQEHSLETASIDDRQVREGVLLFYIGLCYCRKADLQPGENKRVWQEARSYFQQCINVFERSNRQDLVAKFISQLGQVLRRLEEWQALECLAQKALELHQNLEQIKGASFEVQLAQDYSFLAEVALHRQKWRSAKHSAEKALQLLEQSSSSKPKHQALSLLLLARSRKHLGNLQLATLDLEQAQALGASSDPPLHQHDPQLYINILQELRSLYFQQGRYLDAFSIKQEQHKIEHQYGFRAFIGATQLQPQQQALNPARDTLKTATVAHEIASASRARDIQRLVERVSRTDCKLTIIHGYSGVGKSSMVNAGLIPELRQRAIGDRIVLPVVLPVYTHWSRELGKRLTQAQFSPVESSDRDQDTETLSLMGEQIGTSAEGIVEQLRHNINRNLLTVLIFDQFEEFFFVYPHQSERKEFYKFLCQCLNLPFVKIILSLREDYLHYLLEFDHIPNLDAINNNILDKSIRYSLGNFSPEDTGQIVRDLTEKTHFYLESNLIDELVRDLSMELGQVRPIELQLVGAQLQEEKITTLSQYLLLGANPKDKLIERSLVQIVRDCGQANAQAAWKVLSALVDEKNTRPLRTKEELAEAIGESENSDVQLNGDLQLSAVRSQLDLILKIFEGSGLVFRHREESGDRYQLVHDYLVRPIRQRDEVNLAKRLKKSEAAQQLSQRQLEQRNRQLNWLVAGLTCVTCFSVFSWQRVVTKNSELENQKRQVETIARTATAEVYLSSSKVFDAVLESLRAKKEWQKLKNGDYPTQLRVIATLQQAIYQVKEGNRLEGHKDIVWDVSYSPDGKLIASGSTDKTVKLWKANGELLRDLHHDDNVTKISFSPDNQLLATASLDKTIKIWTLDGTLLNTLKGHRGKVYGVSFSPDRQLLVSSSEDCTIKLWNRQGQLLKTFVDEHAPQVQNPKIMCQSRSSHQGDVLDVSFSPDGQFIVSASSDETVKIWTLHGTLMATLKGHKSKVNAVRFAPNSQLLVSASDDRTLKFWQRDGTLLKTLEAHPTWIHSVAFSPDGKTIASSSDDKTIKLWTWDGVSLETLSLSETLEGHSDGVLQVSFHPTRNELASSSEDKTIKIWHLDRKLDKHRLTAHHARVENVSFSPDGRTVATASRDCTVKLWNVDGTLQTTLIDRSNNAHANPKANCDPLASHNDFVLATSFSPNGKLVATASRDCTVKLWNLDGTLVRTFYDPQLKPGQEVMGDTCMAQPTHSDYVLGLSFSSNGQSIATASRDKTVKLWSLDGKLLNTLRGHTERVNSVSFSPNGQLIASGGDDQTIRVWRPNGTLVRMIDKQENYDPGHTSYITSVGFSPDSRTLASAGWDNTVKLWDLDGNLLKEFSDSDSVNSVSFSPQGQVIAAGSWNGTVKLWSLIDGTLIKSLQGHKSGVLSVSFSPDGRTIASGSADETAILWDLDFDRLFQESCQWLGDYMQTNPNVTPDDRGLCDGNIEQP